MSHRFSHAPRSTRAWVRELEHSLRRALPVLCLLAGAAAPARALQSDLIGEWPVPPSPAGNPPDGRVRLLGQLLFWEEQLSSDNTMACGTCHDFAQGGADPRATAQHPSTLSQGSFGMRAQDVLRDYVDDAQFGTGRQLTPMTAPSVLTSGFFERLFWDRSGDDSFEDEAGNALIGFEQHAGLEAQAVLPVTSAVEMGHGGIQWADVTAKLAGTTPWRLATAPPPAVQLYLGYTYEVLFDWAFGTQTPNVTRERVAQALAAYQRTLVPNNAPIDAPAQLSPSEANGLALFTQRPTKNQFARSCSACHSASLFGGLELDGPLFAEPNDNVFSDGLRHAIGLNDVQSANDGVPFRTPSLRNVGLRKRFMHDGRMSTLDEVLDFYNGDPTHGDAKFGFAQPLSVSELADLKAFLLALTDPNVASNQPPFDRPTLYSETHPFESNLYGDTSPPQPSNAPRILASDPPLVDDVTGNPYFRVGIAGVGANTPAMLLLSPGQDTGTWHLGIHFWIDHTNFTPEPVQTVSGVGTYHLSAPLSDAGLIGVPFYAQWMVFDPAGRTATEAASFLRL